MTNSKEGGREASFSAFQVYKVGLPKPLMHVSYIRDNTQFSMLRELGVFIYISAQKINEKESKLS